MIATSYSPGGGDDMLPPMAARLVADLHPSADGSAVHMAELQAAIVHIA